MSVLALPFLGAPVNAETENPACLQSGGHVDSFTQRASTSDDWTNGDLTEGLYEGGFVWEKVDLSGLQPGTHEIVLDYTYQWKTAYAFDFLNQLTMDPGTASNVTLDSYSSETGHSVEVLKRATLTWAQPADSKSQTIIFAAHLASESQPGAGNGAASIPGSSSHLTLQTLDCKSVGSKTNQVTVDKQPPTPEEATVTVEKFWQINGEGMWQEYRPQGFEAQLTLTGPGTAGATNQDWGKPRGGYAIGDEVTIDESATVPQQCTIDRSLFWENGKWVVKPLPYTTKLALADNVYKVKNEVTCTTSITVSKVDDATGKAIDTATFQLWSDVNGDRTLDPQDTKIGTTTSTSGGIATWTGLAYGDYLVEETAAPAGYTLPSPSYQPVTVDKNHLWPTLTFRDIKKPVPPTGSITVRKHAGTTGGALIDTAKFQLWNDVNGNKTLDANDSKAGTERSTSGGISTWTGLPYGNYLVQETVAPAGYTLPTPSYQPTTVNGAVTLDFVDQPKVTPPPVTPRIDLQVRKHAGTTAGALLDTATFQLWNDVDHNGALDKAVDARAGTERSTSKGIVTWSDLAPGAYLVEETVAPSGYTLPDPAYQAVTLTAAQDATTVVLDFADQPKVVPTVRTVNLQVRKHAGSVTGRLIDTATFQLWNDVDGDALLDRSVDTRAGSTVDTSGGTYTWTGLAIGTYLVQEVAAPEGYSLPSPRYQAVTLAAADLGTTVTVDFADAQIAGVEEVRPPSEVAPVAGHVPGPSYGGVGVLPQTGARERNELLGLLGTALVALGGGLLLTSRRRSAQR